MVSVNDNEQAHSVKKHSEATSQSSAKQLKQSNVVDTVIFDKLLKLFGDRFEAVIDQFIASSNANIERIEVSIQQSDISSFEISAHSLKGASAQFGVLALNEVAAEMEAFAKSGHIQDAELLLPLLKQAQNDFVAVIKELLAMSDTDSNGY